MNRMVLLLNVVVLVVNFTLAMSATDSQIGVLRSTSRVAYGTAFSIQRSERAIPYLRVVQSLERIAPQDTLADLDAEGLASIYEAVNSYEAVVRSGVVRALGETGDSQKLRRNYADLGREARAEVERTLSSVFRDAGFVSRLTAEIITQCR